MRLVQWQKFVRNTLAYVALKGGKQVKCQSKLTNLSPILVDSIMRVGGRIHRAPSAFEAGYPMVSFKSHPVSVLIVRTLLPPRFGTCRP